MPHYYILRAMVRYFWVGPYTSYNALLCSPWSFAGFKICNNWIQNMFTPFFLMVFYKDIIRYIVYKLIFCYELYVIWRYYVVIWMSTKTVVGWIYKEKKTFYKCCRHLKFLLLLLLFLILINRNLIQTTDFSATIGFIIFLTTKIVFFLMVA